MYETSNPPNCTVTVKESVGFSPIENLCFWYLIVVRKWKRFDICTQFLYVYLSSFSVTRQNVETSNVNYLRLPLQEERRDPSLTVHLGRHEPDLGLCWNKLKISTCTRQLTGCPYNKDTGSHPDKNPEEFILQHLRDVSNESTIRFSPVS